MQEKMPKVSIVIPIYNAERYLKMALLDISKQTYKNIEVICVDDGSIDGSLNIIEQFVISDSRFRLVKQNNQYAGVARNNGLNCASGEYILFLDADDRFERNMIRSLVETIEREKVDVVYFGYDTFVGKGRKISEERTYYKNKKIKTCDVRESIFQLHSGAPWMIFYSTSYIKKNGIKFSATQNCNDIYFTCMNAVLANYIYFLDKILVHYRTGNNNSLQGSSTQNIKSFYIAMKEIFDELRRRQMLDEYLVSLKKLYIENIYFHSTKQMDYETLKTFFDYSVELFEMVKMNINDDELMNCMPLDVFSSILEADFSKFLFYKYISYKNIQRDFLHKVTAKIKGAYSEILNVKIKKFENDK